MEGSDLSTLRQDDLYPRFEELFKEFFGSPASFGIVIEPDEFRRLFYYSWDQKVPPSKEILVKAVHIKPTSLVSLEEVEDHVAKTFATALEKLRIEEHKQEASLPQEAQQKPKPGLEADEKTQQRGEIVRNCIHEKSDFHDEETKQALLKEFEVNEIPLLKDSEGTPKHIGISEWADYIQKSHLWGAAVDDILNRDRFPRKRTIATE